MNHWASHWVSTKANQLKLHDRIYLGAYHYIIINIIPLLENNLRLELVPDECHYYGSNPRRSTLDVFNDQYIMISK